MTRRRAITCSALVAGIFALLGFHVYSVGWGVFLDNTLNPRHELARQDVSRPFYRQNYDFRTDWFTHNLPFWLTALDGYRGRPLNYLEVGLYEGRSAMWMLENILTHPDSTLTGLDIFDGELKERYLANLELSGAAGKAETIVGPSQVTLRDLPLEHYDVIYIDGSHAAADVLEDAVLSWRLLKPGGLLIFDDYRYRDPVRQPRDAIDPFVEVFREHLEVIHNGYQMMVRKNL